MQAVQRLFTFSLTSPTCSDERLKAIIIIKILFDVVAQSQARSVVFAPRFWACLWYSWTRSAGAAGVKATLHRCFLKPMWFYLIYQSVIFSIGGRHLQMWDCEVPSLGWKADISGCFSSSCNNAAGGFGGMFIWEETLGNYNQFIITN